MKRHAIQFMSFCLLATACSLVNLSHHEEYTSTPSQEYEVLSQGSPIEIQFCQDADHYSVENAVNIKDHEGNVDIKILWESDRLMKVYPKTDPVPGLEYRLEFNGYYSLSDGRSVESKLSLPFYWGKNEYTPLRILSVIPDEGALIAADTALKISFSSDVDAASLARGLSISPNIKMKHAWSDQTLIMSPLEDWENLTSYTLKITDDLKNSSGDPLFPLFERSFYVQYGTEIPSVLSVGSCSRNLSSDFRFIASDLSGLKRDQALRVSFSQPMDHGNTESAFTLMPSLAGDFFWCEDPMRPGVDDLVFLPRDGFLMSQTYKLCIDSSAMGKSGISMDSDFQIDFVPDLEEMSLLSLECLSYGGFILNCYNDASSYDLPAGPVSPFSLSFRFIFSVPFSSDAEKQIVQSKLKIYEIFSTGGSPQAGLFSWSDDYTMTVLFSGFNTGAASDFYYILELPGGEGGIINRNGSFFPSDIRQLFRVHQP